MKFTFTRMCVWIHVSCMLMAGLSLADDNNPTNETSESDLPRLEEQITVSGKAVLVGVIPSSNPDINPAKSIQTNNLTDLADMLTTEFVEINMIRKSGYGNEISLRGFSQGDLRTTVNGCLLEGCCGSRKDPALSLISLMNIDRMSVQQGPFDVTVPGALGGAVDVQSKHPEQGFHGSFLTRYADTEAPSAGLYLHGGSETLRLLAGYQYASSKQYEDGDGDSLASFRDNSGRPYRSSEYDNDAFTKEDIWARMELNPADNHTIQLEHSYGLGEDILTPRAGMDIEEEETNLTRLSYEAMGLSRFFNRLTVSLYRNDVSHQPSDRFRELVGNPTFHRHNDVQSTITGLKIENVLPVNTTVITFGMDSYFRNWDGDMVRDDTGQKMIDLIPDVDTRDIAGYVQVDMGTETMEYSAGLRFDHLNSEAQAPLTQSSMVTDTNEVTNTLLSGFASLRHTLTDNLSWYAGIGHSARFPTSVERYLQSPSPYFHGNPDLAPAKNTEFDAGITMKTKRLTLNVKAMYSSVADYIYQMGKQTDESHQSWTNIDAIIFGGDVSTSIHVTDDWTITGGAALYKGEKDSQPDQYNTDTDLAGMAPLKTHLGIEYSNETTVAGNSVRWILSSQWIHSARADDVDEDAGEKQLDSWDTGNVKLGLQTQSFELAIGVDNILDEQYAVANSYEWDVVAGDGANPTIVNEPGRTVYLNVGFRF